VKVTLTREALADLENIAEWIAQDNPRRAQSFSAELRVKCASIGRSPRRYPVIHRSAISEIRKRSHGHYLIFFRIMDDHVDIMRIVHMARDWASDLDAFL
jgi:toxin ParE1/3/4